MAEKIQQQQDKCFHIYGYRRIWQWLENSEEIFHKPKTILRVTNKYGLLSKIHCRRRWQYLHEYQNLLNRNFQAEALNRKWVTDISYIQTKQGVLYLSMIRDLYDNSIMVYKTATQQIVNLVLDTIVRQEKKKVAAELKLHSDQGFQYTSQAYFNQTKEYGITPSMSRRGNLHDNAMAENFFSILKTECIPATNRLHSPIYNHERIQSKTGVAQHQRRHSC